MFKIIAAIAAALVALLALGYILTMSVGKPISSDLSVVGKGKPALVLAYENFSPTGGAALNRLRQVRSDYDAQLDFLVADMGTPQGKAFAERYQLVDGLAVFLTQDGLPVQITAIAADEQELRSRLDAKLAAVK
jgi:hypothetical protein